MSDVTKPKIVCLCGSTRFHREFVEANLRESLAGNIVLTVAGFSNSAVEAHGRELDLTEEDKRRLDVLHKQKIDMADEVLFLNVGGYVGPSGRSEIEHAEATGVPIRYLEPEGVT